MQRESNLNLQEGDHKPQAHMVMVGDRDLRHTRDHNPEIETKIDTGIVMIDTDQNRGNVIRIPKEADMVEVDQVNQRLTPDQTPLEAQITLQIQDLKQS